MLEKRSRPFISSSELNEKELEWWNRNGEFMADAWDYDQMLSSIIRHDYLTKAKRFLSIDKSVHVLEPGCGSGGIGRLIAGPNFHITGIDWSKSVTSIAIQKAYEMNLSEFCNYITADFTQCKHLLEKADGVLIHAFLHHLDDQELDRFLKTLMINLNPNARIWVYEPTFFLESVNTHVSVSPRTQIYLELAQLTIETLNAFYRKKNIFDYLSFERLTNLFQDANKNGWYLSPKEVPFDLYELTNKLEQYFSIQDTYWATVNMYGWAYDTHLIQDVKLRQDVVNTYIKFLVTVDKLLALDEGYLRQNLVKPNHAFHVWECINVH